MIEIEGLRFGYRRQKLYEHFDLRLSEPGLYGLFGRNGSGKSTLLKLMAGLLFRHAGRIRVGGLDPQQRDPALLADIYLVPEEFHLPNLSCARLAKLQAGFYPRFSQEIFDEALATFDVDPQAPFGHMSLGGKKKAVIAFALATLTPVLLLDEPTNGLDIVGRDHFRQLLQRPEQAGRIVLISTHQAHDLEQVLSRILFIEDGRLALFAPMDELAQRLRMGVVDGSEIELIENVVYQETIGAQVAYVAKRNGTPAAQPVQLELLYRALCRAPDRLLPILAEEGVRHV